MIRPEGRLRTVGMTVLPTPAASGSTARPVPAAPSPDPSPVEAVIDALGLLTERFTEAGDARRWFAGTYLRTTLAVRDEIARGGFEDPDWVERWDLAFALLYVDAVDDWARTGTAAGPWAVAFAAAADPSVPPLRHVLLGLNAHINFDLAPSLLAVVSSDDFDDPALIASRRRDCRHIDDVLAARVPDEDRELARTEPPGSRTTLDRLLTPFNRLGTTRFLAESRRKVWRNAELLDQARRRSHAAHEQRMTELARLSADRVADLRRPGQVLLRLAVRGFGVSLAE